MKPKGIIDYSLPWFIPLFCFIAGYFLGSTIEVKIRPTITTVNRSI